MNIRNLNNDFWKLVFVVHQPRLDAWDKCLGLVHWEDPEESGGERGGRGIRDGEYM